MHPPAHTARLKFLEFFLLLQVVRISHGHDAMVLIPVCFMVIFMSNISMHLT